VGEKRKSHWLGGQEFESNLHRGGGGKVKGQKKTPHKKKKKKKQRLNQGFHSRYPERDTRNKPRIGV